MLTITADELPRFMQCNGSSKMMDQRPPHVDDSTARDEGTAAHWLALQVYRGTSTFEELADRKAPNGVFITPEMVEHIEWYLSQLPAPGGSMEVDASYTGQTWCVNGRADHIAYFADAGTLRVGDFKFGWRIAEPERNWTLISHAIGYCIAKQIAPREIVLTIYQPRPHHRDGKAREWRISYDELMTHYHTLANALGAPADKLNTGPHCAKCPAITHCPAAIAAMYNAIDASEALHTEEMDDATLAHDLDLISRAQMLLKNRNEALEELAKHRLRNGKVIANYGIETQLTNRVWRNGVTADMVMMMTGKDVSKKDMITPAQAERLGISKETMNAFAERRETGVKLVRVDANKKAQRIFGGK